MFVFPTTKCIRRSAALPTFVTYSVVCSKNLSSHTNVYRFLAIHAHENKVSFYTLWAPRKIGLRVTRCLLAAANHLVVPAFALLLLH